MTLKEIKARYKRVFLGFLWAILNPIIQMLMIGFVFQHLIPIKIDNYFYFLFSGLLPWNFFSYSVITATPIILNERSLIQKAKFPREALILSIVFSNLFHFIISIFLFISILQFSNIISLARLFTLLIATSWLVFFTMGLSLLLATLFVRYRDIKFIVNAIIPLWFYATPIIYTRSLLPNWINILIQLNPLTGIIELFQFSLLGTSNISITDYFPGFAISLTVIISAIYLYIKNNQNFDDWL